MNQKTYHIRTCLLGIMLPKKDKQNSFPLMFLVPSILSHQHMDYYECMGSFKRFREEQLPDRECLYSSVKDGTTGDNGEKLDGYISDEDYLTCNKIWNEFNMKNMGDYHNHCLEKDG